jgi:hypothetical protein
MNADEFNEVYTLDLRYPVNWYAIAMRLLSRILSGSLEERRDRLSRLAK